MTVVQKHTVPPLSREKQQDCRRGWILCDFGGSYTQVKIRWARDWRLKRTPDSWFSSNWIWNDYSYLKRILKSCCSYSTWRQGARLFICSRGLHRRHCKYFGSESPRINNPNTNNIFCAAGSGEPDRAWWKEEDRDTWQTQKGTSAAIKSLVSIPRTPDCFLICFPPTAWHDYVKLFAEKCTELAGIWLGNFLLIPSRVRLESGPYPTVTPLWDQHKLKHWVFHVNMFVFILMEKHRLWGIISVLLQVFAVTPAWRIIYISPPSK